jgi:hypothetical protein
LPLRHAEAIGALNVSQHLLRSLAGAGRNVASLFDEGVVLLAAVALFVFYREPMGEAWRLSAPPARL